jgi:hypothetical protein
MRDFTVTVWEGAGMIGAPRGAGHESEVLLRQLDARLARLRAGREPADIELAERIARALRRLVAETAVASAADRARVRAAVHYFVLRRDGHGEHRPGRPLASDVRVVNDILCALGRYDLLITLTPEPA